MRRKRLVLLLAVAAGRLLTLGIVAGVGTAGHEQEGRRRTRCS